MKHKDTLQAWLNGETVEYLNIYNQWIALPPPNETESAPGFFDNKEYRIKPKTSFVFFHTTKLFTVCIESFVSVFR